MAQKKNGALAGSYRWFDKDPAIDAFRWAHEKSGVSLDEIANGGGPTVGTLRSWLDGRTRKPQKLTYRFAMSACGFHRELWANDNGVMIEVDYSTEKRKNAAPYKVHEATNTGKKTA